MNGLVFVIRRCAPGTKRNILEQKEKDTTREVKFVAVNL